MSFKNLEILFNKSRSLYFFVDMNTQELLYVNESFCDFFKSNAEDLINRKYYEVIFNNTTQNENNLFENNNSINETSIYDKKINDTDFRVVVTNLNESGKDIKVFKLTKSQIIQDNNFNNKMVDCIEILKSENSFEDSIDELLQIITEYYKADGCYILTINYENLLYEYPYSYIVKNDISRTESIEQKVLLRNLSRWSKFIKSLSYIVIDDIETQLPKESIEYKHLKANGVKSVFATPIKNGSEILGFVLITNPSNLNSDKFLFYSTTIYIKENMCRLYMIDKANKKQNIDELTGFFNRAEYNKKLNEYVENPPEQLGIIFCDINGLRKTNTDYGYEKGDKKIVECTQIMQRFFDEDFYRIGGDEFICFIEVLDEDEFYNKVSTLRELTQTDPKAAFSIGCTWRNGDKISVKQVADADNMMYLNKQKYYQNATFSSQTEGIDLLQDLLVAIKKDEFQVYLQPKILLETDEIIGAEALVRRYDSDKGKLIFPDQFIPLYENEAIIRHVDLEVLRKVCEMQKVWIGHGKKLKVSVNFSRVTLKEDDIVNEIVRICDAYEIPHELIMVEITERIGLLDDADVSDNLIKALVSNGFNLSLDDFGCAYSNIVTLSKIDVHEVKIDKSLVDFIETNKKNQIIVRNIIDMCNEMDNTETVSEGIETEEQADLLKQFNCKQGQGFLYSRPLPATEFYKKYVV